MHDGSVGSLAVCSSTGPRRELRWIDAARRQVFLDGERHPTLESRGRQDAALVARFGEPLDDRAKAVCHPRGGIADAVVVDEEKAHARSIIKENGKCVERVTT
jgi:hypothetical protein